MKLSKLISRTESKQRVRGQGMSEYMIIVGVIAAAAIATFGYFGETIEGQVGQQATVLGGSTTAVTNAKSAAAAASTVTNASRANTLSTYDAAAAAN